MTKNFAVRRSAMVLAGFASIFLLQACTADVQDDTDADVDVNTLTGSTIDDFDDDDDVLIGTGSLTDSGSLTGTGTFDIDY